MANTASSSARAFLLACLVSAAAWGGDWKITPGIALSERFSDNVTLAARGLEESDWITEITPRIAIQRSGARLKVNADYSFQGLLYANGSASSTVHHYLNGQANAELVDEWFYLDATARVGQQPIDYSGGFSIGNGFGTGNTSGLGDGVGRGNSTLVGSYTLSPYLKHRFGRGAIVEARVTRDGVFIDDPNTADASGTRYHISAVSGANSQPFSWSANYDKSDTNNQGAADSAQEIASLNARYRLSRKFGLLGQASMEKNSFTNVSGDARDYHYYGLGAFYAPSRRMAMDALYNHASNGNFLSGRLTLHPTPRTAIDMSTSKRGYGRSNSLNLAHRARLSTWSLRYQDDLTDSKREFNNLVGFRCPLGVSFPDPRCIPDFRLTQINDTYVSKTLIGSVDYTLRRNTFGLSLYDYRREYQTTSGSSDLTRGMNASWSLRPAARTTFTLTGGLSRNETRGATSSDDDLWYLSLVASREFQPQVNGSLEVRHQERNSNVAGSDYQENSVAARLNMSF